MEKLYPPMLAPFFNYAVSRCHPTMSTVVSWNAFRM